jgi:hypothetical protein
MTMQWKITPIAAYQVTPVDINAPGCLFYSESTANSFVTRLEHLQKIADHMKLSCAISYDHTSSKWKIDIHGEFAAEQQHFEAASLEKIVTTATAAIENLMYPRSM